MSNKTDVPQQRLPASVTSFIGRHHELKQARRLLRTARLVTLTGPGGVGKTRLALQLATSPGRPFGEVRIRDLASVTSPDQLERALIEALGIYDQPARPAREVLLDNVADRDLLLVLDNCDRVADALGELVDALLRAGPDLVVLATSRRRLESVGEHVLAVPPLSLPDPNAPLTHQVPSRREAVALFVERAKAVRPDFRLTAHNSAQVARLCVGLDGLPLAIELAAARVAVMSVPQLLGCLPQRRFDVLVGGATDYHATLQHVVEWSYQLCSRAEQRLWARLSLFVSGFDLDAAEQVCAGNGIDREDILDVLAGLINQSIVATSRDPQTDHMRYHLLDTIREFGAGHLRDRGEDRTRLLRQHRDYYRRLAAEGRASWCGPQEVRWMRRLQADRGNLQAAMRHSLRTGHADVALQIATDLARSRVCFFEGSWRETLDQLSEIIAANPRPSTVREHAVALRAWIALCQGHPGPAQARLGRYRALAQRPTAHGLVTADAAFVAGVYALLAEGSPEAIRLLARARDEYDRDGEVGWVHMALLFLAFACSFLGDEQQARRASVDCRRHAEQCQTSWGRWWAVIPAGIAELRWGDDAEAAAALFEAALTALGSEGDRWGSLWAALFVACAHAQTGRYETAAHLLCGTHQAQATTGVAMAGLGPFADITARTVDLVIAGLRSQDSYALAERVSVFRRDTLRGAPAHAVPAPRLRAAGQLFRNVRYAAPVGRRGAPRRHRPVPSRSGPRRARPPAVGHASASGDRPPGGSIHPGQPGFRSATPPPRPFLAQ